MDDPIVIDPPNFDPAAAWAECRAHVDQCGGLAHEDGSPNWNAAFGADPGICSCPACGEMYWAWGKVQRCKCGFEYPTDWWPMYSWGVQATRSALLQQSKRHEQRMDHPYYRYGFEHPVADPWAEHDRQEWRDEVKRLFGRTV